MTTLEIPEESPVSLTNFKVAPAAKTVQSDDSEYCSHCEHCATNTVLVCGHCLENLSDGPRETLDCENCLLNFDNPMNAATYIDAAAAACLTKANSRVRDSSRLGWCYLPKGHTSRHYYLQKSDLK